MKFIFTFIALLITTDIHSDIIGKAEIVDGDTIIINDIRIRFTGSDAPESYFFGKTQKCADAKGKEWKCGKAATNKLEQLINNREVRCTDEGLDRYGRTLGICFVGSMDLQSEMVRSGMAVAYLRYSRRYENEQNEAKKAKVGMWAGEFLEPEDWRRENRERDQAIILP